jgi:hypothetical protein
MMASCLLCSQATGIVWRRNTSRTATTELERHR